jgi:hypothetical protein
MATMATMRVPLFFEVDIESGPMRSENGQAHIPLRAVGGRVVSEDGTILGEITFAEVVDLDPEPGGG